MAGVLRVSLNDWLDRRLFELVHGHNLVYNTCWEDPRLDRAALELGRDDTLLAVTSAGCNVLDYALTGPRHIHAVDLNPRQSALLEAPTLELQREIWESRLRERFWSRAMRFAIDRHATLSMVGVPKAQRRQVESHYDGGIENVRRGVRVMSDVVRGWAAE